MPKDEKTDKSLKSKAIDIKGKKYVLVSDRIIHFNQEYPNGVIQTQLLSDPKEDLVVIKATAIPDVTHPERSFSGHSQAKWGDGYINKTSALENAETSAVGRALGMMGIGVIDTVATVDEINKAKGHTGYRKEPDWLANGNQDVKRLNITAELTKVKAIKTYAEAQKFYRDLEDNYVDDPAYGMIKNALTNKGKELKETENAAK